MSPLDGLLYGLAVATTPENLLAAFVGAVLGTAIGVLPGLGPVAGLALMLPLTYSLAPATGLIGLAGIYYGVMYGGSTTSILINIPGETSSMVTAIDGYQMTRRGRAGAALTIVAVGSAIAGTISLVGVMLFAPTLASLALSFGPSEFFALTVVGLAILCRISGGSIWQALLVTALGLLLSTVGVERVTGARRYDFGFLELAAGIDVAPVAIGLFGVAEMLFLVESLASSPSARSVGLRELLPNAEEWRRSVGAWFRGTGVGFVIGLLPGPAATISTFVSYQLEKGVSRRKQEFGRGAVEGVAGPEAANNAAATSALVALLSLGLPFSSTMALLMAGMMIHGVQPGPLLMTRYPELFWGVIASLYVGNVMLLILNLPLVSVWVSLLRIPIHLMVTGILIFAVIGSYSVRNSLFDVWNVIAFGILGYVLRKLEFPLASLILAVVLGPFIEKHLRESLFLSRGDLTIFISRPITIAIWLVGAAIIALGVRGSLAREVAQADPE